MKYVEMRIILAAKHLVSYDPSVSIEEGGDFTAVIHLIGIFYSLSQFPAGHIVAVIQGIFQGFQIRKAVLSELPETDIIGKKQMGLTALRFTDQ